MMASRNGPKGPAPKKNAVTYGKAPRSRPLGSLNTIAESNPYDFPDSDGSDASPTPRKPNPPKMKPATLSRPPNVHRGSTDTGRARVPAKQKENDGDARKRTHSKAFVEDGIVVARPPTNSFSARIKTTQPISEPNPRIIPKSKPLEQIQNKKPRPPTTSNTAPVARMPVRPLKTVGSANATKKLEPPKPQARKPRLIDRLASQAEEESDSETDDSRASEDDRDRTPRHRSQTPASQRASTAMEWSQSRPEQTKTPASKKIKHTYSQARSIREDTQQGDDPYGLSADAQLDSLLSSPPINASNPPFSLPADDFDLDDDEDDCPKSAIKSIHELRRAGANNRFADEMEDLLSRIGAPARDQVSMRRNSLLELAQKLQRDDFAAQFRDHAARDTIAKGIGKETDIISGFAFTSSLVLFLSSNNAPHLLRRLVEERVGKMLSELLRIRDDITVLAAQRAMNVSKAGLASLRGVKSFLLRKPLWLQQRPSSLSPRTMALQLLSILHRYLETRYLEQVIQDSEYELQKIIASEDLYDLEEDEVEVEEDTDTALVIVILESRSGAGIEATEGTQKMARASKISQFLQKTLENWPKEQGEAVTTTLKLVINTTNVEDGAKAFGNTRTLQHLSRCICEGIRQVQEAVEKNTFQAGLYNELLLVLGVTINILEHHKPSRALIDQTSLERLAALYMGNHESIDDADSEQQSKVNVALGYLAVILGYLSLDPQARGVIQKHNNGSGLTHLIESIQKFSRLFSTVDNKMHELEGLVNELQRHRA
ncbi:unnamed protein product [Clonostachys rhizophaga]|uniref:Wings apart-like protein C-terminal domain-containing protein n=1 Tax=Clonostachys rhizophaga TaxID=160324 RepID=A0A9N9VLP7_9HYPO|nr:unnamed protein product [Clonostachys rhizophaga]